VYARGKISYIIYILYNIYLKLTFVFSKSRRLWYSPPMLWPHKHKLLFFKPVDIGWDSRNCAEIIPSEEWGNDMCAFITAPDSMLRTIFCFTCLQSVFIPIWYLTAKPTREILNQRFICRAMVSKALYFALAIILFVSRIISHYFYLISLNWMYSMSSRSYIKHCWESENYTQSCYRITALLMIYIRLLCVTVRFTLGVVHYLNKFNTINVNWESHIWPLAYSIFKTSDRISTKFGVGVYTESCKPSYTLTPRHLRIIHTLSYVSLKKFI
jgi:hypothetical protein